MTDGQDGRIDESDGRTFGWGEDTRTDRRMKQAAIGLMLGSSDGGSGRFIAGKLVTV